MDFEKGIVAKKFLKGVIYFWVWPRAYPSLSKILGLAKNSLK
jgi:hypothetical protein